MSNQKSNVVVIQVEGLECEKCGCTKLPVTRTKRGDGSIRRYRVCSECGHRMITCERSIF